MWSLLCSLFGNIWKIENGKIINETLGGVVSLWFIIYLWFSRVQTSLKTEVEFRVAPVYLQRWYRQCGFELEKRVLPPLPIMPRSYPQQQRPLLQWQTATSGPSSRSHSSWTTLSPCFYPSPTHHGVQVLLLQRVGWRRFCCAAAEVFSNTGLICVWDLLHNKRLKCALHYFWHIFSINPTKAQPRNSEHKAEGNTEERESVALTATGHRVKTSSNDSGYQLSIQIEKKITVRAEEYRVLK